MENDKKCFDWNKRPSFKLLLLASFLLSVPIWVSAQGTANGEIENRPAPVARRMCLAGANAGKLCNKDADCPAATCRDRNIFNLSVAVHYDAPAADRTTIQNMISAGSATLYDVTDGQAEIGQATIHNNSVGTTQADLRVYPATCTVGTSIGAACNTDNDCADTPGKNDGTCGVWWKADTGSWKNAGSIHVSINHINDAAANSGPLIGHELVHLLFDPRDEYESRPGCGINTGNASCPDAASGQVECLMDSNLTELCWGQGNPANLTDMTGGNHDATNVTEQSACRSNRSCWDQVVWSWPHVFLKPAGAPDPAANGGVVDATHFITTENTVRVVLVLDESGSMDLEAPKRIERLKVAAKNFVALAENGTEVGIVSYASDADVASGRKEVAVTALGANRAAWINAIDGLAPSTRTNIGGGLHKARKLIMDAGGVNANTYIVLMTDGLNNEPGTQANANADLAAKVATLQADGIPVYVTCTGSDLGLQSQCSEIAAGAGAGGFYVDSASPARMPEAFAEFHELIAGHAAVDSITGDFAKQKKELESPAIAIEKGSQSASFILQWENSAASADMLVREPNGTSHDTQQMPQGRFLRVKNPAPGNWQMVIRPRSSTASPFVARAFTRNPSNHVSVGIRYPSVTPNGEIYVYAYPKNMGMAVTTEKPILARVVHPDGSTGLLELYDRGRDPAGHGDDVPGDGIFTGVYHTTALKGAYQFLVKTAVDDWVISKDAHENQQEGPSTPFVREVRLSTAVSSPSDVETTPEDPPVQEVNGWCERWVWMLLGAIFFLLLLNLFLTWFCSCRGRLFHRDH